MKIKRQKINFKIMIFSKKNLEKNNTKTYFICYIFKIFTKNNDFFTKNIVLKKIKTEIYFSENELFKHIFYF